MAPAHGFGEGAVGDELARSLAASSLSLAALLLGTRRVEGSGRL